MIQAIGVGAGRLLDSDYRRDPADGLGAHWLGHETRRNQPFRRVPLPSCDLCWLRKVPQINSISATIHTPGR